MSIYTKKGDRGFTRLYNGKKVSKASKIIWALGSIDELNSSIGVAVAYLTRKDEQQLKNELTLIQNTIFVAGSQLAQADQEIDNQLVNNLEESIDKIEKTVGRLDKFILPGGAKSASQIHQSRAICRKVERYLVGLDVSSSLIQYFNRLSDYLFMAARLANYINNNKEITRS